LKLVGGLLFIWERACSIHPQGWVPIETDLSGDLHRIRLKRSIHPQGWVPIETRP